ncbi:MAG: zinc-dependent alcohol dehydrogenase family protein [Magnetococcales bacterium]|nr:zinc-dependent alcohol dehydrogenase family protein [Magnetococcales bacterium]
MKAMLLDSYGSAATFRLAEVARPQVKPGHVLLRVVATSVNPIDVKIRTLGLPLAPELPAILHGDVAGVVEEVGLGVTGFQPGDEVFGCVGGVKGSGGALAEYLLADACLLAHRPTSCSLAECAALPLVTLTAWEGLIDRANIRPGDPVLVHAGAGGVGHIALQLARLRGAVVTTTVSSPGKAKLARELGADHTIDYRTTSVADQVRHTPQGLGFSLVFDTVGMNTLDASFQAVRPGGTVVTCVARSTHDLSALHAKGVSLHVVFMLLPLLTGQGRAHQGDVLRRTAALVDAGRLRPLLHPRQFSLAEIQQAHAVVAEGKAMGKVLVRVD